MQSKLFSSKYETKSIHSATVKKYPKNQYTYKIIGTIFPLRSARFQIRAAPVHTTSPCNKRPPLIWNAQTNAALLRNMTII